jgi:plasmid maintenance system antidote protein VapI
LWKENKALSVTSKKSTRRNLHGRKAATTLAPAKKSTPPVPSGAHFATFAAALKAALGKLPEGQSLVEKAIELGFCGTDLYHFLAGGRRCTTRSALQLEALGKPAEFWLKLTMEDDLVVLRTEGAADTVKAKSKKRAKTA